jgi:hypothetical protein
MLFEAIAISFRSVKKLKKNDENYSIILSFLCSHCVRAVDCQRISLFLAVASTLSIVAR